MKKTQVFLVDDIDGTQVDDNGETLFFALDGVQYEIDLSNKNSEKLRKALEPYISAGRRVSRFSGPSAASSKKSTRKDLQQIRDWATEQGMEVSSRGRIAQNIVDAYDASH